VGPRRWKRAALAAGILVCACAGVGWMRWRGWSAALPPPLPPAAGHAEALRALTTGGSLIRAEEVPASALRFPRWRMELRRPFLYRRAHVRTWLVAARLTGILPGSPAAPPGQAPEGPPAPRSAEVWIIGVEGYCRQIGVQALGRPEPPPPPGALCWTDLAYSGTTGRELWAVSGGAPPG
jgi:hypothetical protein